MNMIDYFYIEEFDTEATAEALCKLANTTDNLTLDETEKALYHLKSMAMNKYNKDYFRTLAAVLHLLTENVETGAVKW